MIKQIKFFLLISFFLSLLPQYLHANDDIEATQQSNKQQSGFLYGVGFSSSTQIYKGYQQRTMVLPLIGFKSENLTVFGPFITYKFATFNHFSIAAKLSPRFQGYDQSDSYIFKGMKERKNSLDAGFELNYKNNGWQINISSLFDTLNRSNGYEIKTALSRTIIVGPIFITPTVSVNILDKNLVDYYYGVTENETNELRTAFIGQQAQNIAVGLSIATPIFLGSYTRLAIQQTWFDSNITNSPLVDSNNSLSLQLFFSKNF